MAGEKSLVHLAAGEAPDPERLTGIMAHEPIVQEYIPSTAEYIIGALYYWLAASGRQEEIDCDYDLGVGTHSLHGELRHLLSIVRTDSPLVAKPPVTRRAREILTSCLREPNFDYLSLDDPGPFVRGLRNELSKGR